MHINTAVIVGASLAASSNAFSTSSSFTRQLPPSRYHDQPSAYRSTTSTALSMNLFDRFQRVAKSNINNVLKSLEDPEKIMNQAVEDMQVSLRRIINGILLILRVKLKNSPYAPYSNIIIISNALLLLMHQSARLIWSKFVNPMQKLPPRNVAY